MKIKNNRRRYRYSLFKHLDFLLTDLVVIETAFFLACQIRAKAFLELWDKYFHMAGIIFIAFVFIVAFWNVYSGVLRRSFLLELKSVAAMIAGVFVFLTMYCFASKSTEEYSRAVLIAFFGISIVAVFITRIIWKIFVRKKIKRTGEENLIFIHEKDAEEHISYFSDKMESGIIASGIVTYDKSDRSEICGIPVVGSKEDFIDYISENNVSSVFFHLEDANVNHYIDILVRKNITVYRMLRNLENKTYQYSIVDMNGYKTLCVREKEKPLGVVVLKRVQDILISLSALIITLPITVATAIAIKIEDGGPVFYVSKRMGQYGKEFNIFKFRSMKVNADKLEDVLTPEELQRYYTEYKLDNDPRVTKVGNFIRKYSIDELPQFINILIGNMALIGPRPILEKELEENYPEHKELLLSLKPGLTGYWQAYGRNNVIYQTGERQAMELYYIEHFSTVLDLKIFFKTIKVVLTAEGAK